ncbi:uncharacterized protein LOC134664850 [Cydia fagiglandana]|uniref:uncharacterized protein LOC134664850 n=1 Tax=Cydia fagiglandana TaxID=1458189 RepID=UPI002FEE5385
MWKYNLFIVLTCLCARATSFEIFDEANLVPEMCDETDEENTGVDFLPDVFDTVINSTKNVIESVLLPDSNTTGKHDDLNSTKCIGNGLLDFIQCVVASKIESFRQDLSEVAFPKTRPGVFKRHNMNSKIQGSLEEWIKEFIKDMDPDTNCTSDE